MDAKALLIMAAIGVIAGFLASLVVGGVGGLLGYLIAGVLGAFVGGFVFNALGIKLNVGGPIGTQIITSTVGAIIVIVLARLIL
ncbi:MAG: GlsB/YeaQ/YmgE family stress response membrane protein [Pseudomonadota bacterium]